MSTTDLQLERQKLGLPPNGPDSPDGSARSIRERASEDFPVVDITETEDEELFVLEQGRRVTLKDLIAKNIPISYAVNLNSKSFKGGSSMGMLSFADPDVLLIVPARQSGVKIDAHFDEAGYIKDVTIRANFRPLTAHDVKSPEGRALLGQTEI